MNAPRRALMLTPDEGRLDRRIAQQANTLARRGWDVEVAAVVDPTLVFDGDLEPRVRLIAASPPIHQRASGRLRNAKRWLREHSQAGFWLADAIQFLVRDTARAIQQDNVAFLAARPAYDLIVAHDIPVLPLALRLRGSQATRVICDFHETFPRQEELFPSPISQRYWRAVERRLVDANGALFVNRGVADDVQRRVSGGPPNAIVLNAVPGVVASRRRSRWLRDAYGIPDHVRILLFAGSLRADNNLCTVIEGFHSATLPGWALVFLGEGPAQREMEALIDRRRLRASVFVGIRSQQTSLIEAMSGADVGLLPYESASYNTRVATPNKLFEYIQARLPIAGSALPVVEQLMAPFGTYLTMDFAAPNVVAHGLRSLVEHRLAGVPSQALEGAAQHYRWETEEPRFLNLLQQVGITT